MTELKRVIGLMSGTSMDGIDVALIETDGLNHVKPLAHAVYPFEAGFVRRIEAGLSDARLVIHRLERPGNLEQLEREITVRHANAVSNFLRENEIAPSTIDLIGFHGQTILHRPEKALTIQLGDGELLAQQTGIDVVYDMRAKDMKNGGQGAPLVPVYHQALTAQLDKKISDGGIGFINIGGISNATFIFDGQDPIALDCGPGNALIDQWVKAKAGLAYDDGGKIASEGKADDGIIEHYMKLPFFAAKGPKSLDRGDFSLDLIKKMKLANGAATLAKLTAMAIAKAVTDLPKPPKTIIVAGGGAKNAAIMNYLEAVLGKSCKVMTADHYGFNADMVEAEAWAYLAARSRKRLPLTFPTTTGCKQPVSGGVIARAI